MANDTQGVFEIRGEQLWQARKRLGVSRGVVGRILGVNDKTYGAIERKNAEIPPEAREQAALFVQLATGADDGADWQAKEREPKVELPFARPACPKCAISLVVKSAQHTSPQRGTYFYFRCKVCRARFWSSDGTLHAVNEGRGNWKNVKGRPKCPDCNRVCWVETRSSVRHGKRLWKCQKCDKLYALVSGKPVLAVLPKRLKRSPLKNRDCPKCGGHRLRIRSRPPNASYWYFSCPDCPGRFRWNKKLNRLVVAKGPSRKRHAGRKPGMTLERIAEAEQLERLVVKFGGERGAFKKAVEQFRKESYPLLDYHTMYERCEKMRYDLKRSKKTGRK